jgi:hypothetical protein
MPGNNSSHKATKPVQKTTNPPTMPAPAQFTPKDGHGVVVKKKTKKAPQPKQQQPKQQQHQTHPHALTFADVESLEAAVMKGPEHANKIVALLKGVRAHSPAAASSASASVALACVHALRRIFVHQAEQGMIGRPVRSRAGGETTAADNASDPAQLFAQWSRKQYMAFLDALLAAITVRILRERPRAT